MTRILVLLLAAVTAFPAASYAQAGTAAQSVEPFKVGTFLIGNAETVGIVLRDALVVDLAQANAALQKSRSFPARAMPADMVALINDYENGLKGRIYAIVNDLVQSKALEGTRPAYVRELSQVRTLAPIPRPRMMMMTAVNFYSHINETGSPEERAKSIAARKANRGVPYMFLKAPSSVIGTGETILIPHGRTELDWEIELATVIGRRARYVPAPKAQDHVFGYTVMLDISDRGGRPPGGFSAGTDWFVMKGQDTFGPMGPFIVPKEFFGNPMTDLKQTLARRRRSAAAVRLVGHDPFGLGGARVRLVARHAAAGRRHRRRHVWRRRHGDVGARLAGVARRRRRDHGDDRPHRHAAPQSRSGACSTGRDRIVSAAGVELPSGPRGRGGAAQPSGGAGRGAPGQ